MYAYNASQILLYKSNVALVGTWDVVMNHYKLCFSFLDCLKDIILMDMDRVLEEV